MEPKETILGAQGAGRERVQSHEWALQAELNEQLLPEVTGILGQIPGRWGRMVPLARLLLVEVGRLLQDKNILPPGQKFNDLGLKVGFIGGSKRGCIDTDQAFIATMEEGAGLASPALFGYTLSNVALAEAASHYGLVGPVYALIDLHDPMGMAIQEAKKLLHFQDDLFLMIACEFDHFGDQNSKEKIRVTLTIVGRDGDTNPDLS